MTVSEFLILRSIIKGWRKVLYRQLMLPMLGLIDRYPDSMTVDQTQQITNAAGHTRAAFELLRQFGRNEPFVSQNPTDRFYQIERLILEIQAVPYVP